MKKEYPIGLNNLDEIRNTGENENFTFHEIIKKGRPHLKIAICKKTNKVFFNMDSYVRFMGFKDQTEFFSNDRNLDILSAYKKAGKLVKINDELNINP
ncbi:MAG: hypothetical protein AB7E36_14890 [Salinivirgaceae bacterium]